MNVLASSVISSKLSSSNSHSAAVTRARVSASLPPWNGDSPLSLEEEAVSLPWLFQPISSRWRQKAGYVQTTDRRRSRVHSNEAIINVKFVKTVSGGLIRLI